MLGVPEWLFIIILALIFLGGPRLVHELGRSVGETRKAVEGTREKAKEIETEVHKEFEGLFIGSIDPLRVFVCSMQEELEPERSAIAERLRQLEQELGLTRPILFESLPASPDTPEEVYRRAVERCDVFVVIVAEDVSAPVLREHQIAVENKKPCFYFVKSVEGRSDAAQRFLADIVATWVPFGAPEELARKVIAALVADLLENYRQHRLAYTDVFALLALGEQLQIDRRLLERVKEQAKQEQILEKHSWEPEMVRIPAGKFWMGTDRRTLERVGVEWQDWFSRETLYHQVYLPTYYIAKTPVTNAQYLAFVRATNHRIPFVDADWAKPFNWDQGRKAPPQGKENHPVVLVSWRDAVAYCRWLAEATGRPYRLPTEAEWEKAARGTDGRIWPWGNEWDASKCNTSEGGKGDTTPVGSYPQGASPYGLLDMAGNVWEWTSSLYKGYPYRADDGREDLSSSDSRVLRGGSWDCDAGDARSACRGSGQPHSRYVSGGFRCGLSSTSSL